jgi:hypothetical protein
MQAGGPPLHLTLLIDAEEAIYSLRLREAVLSMASAVEIAATRYSESHGGRTNRAIREVISQTGLSFAKRYFHQMPLAINNKSFKKEQGDLFRLVEQMYQQRNSLMHTGSFDESIDSSGADRQKLAYAWYKASLSAVRWLDGLSS